MFKCVHVEDLRQIPQHPGVHDRILLNYTRIDNAYKRKKTFDFLLFIKVQQIFCFLFSLLRHIIKWLNAPMLTTAVFELVQHIMLLKLVMQPMGSALALLNLSSQIKAIASDKVNYRARAALSRCNRGSCIGPLASGAPR